MRTNYTPTGTRISLDGDKLRGLRLSLGMTLSEVATVVGCSFAAIGHYEREAMTPGADAINGLRRVFGDALEQSGALVVRTMAEMENAHLDERFQERMDDEDAE
jgi:predicted transcriptional regulator